MPEQPPISRWHAVLASFMIAGSGFLLLGRRVVAVAWFLGVVTPAWVAVFFLASPRFTSLAPFFGAAGASLAAWLAMLVHSHRAAGAAAEPGAHRPAVAGLLSAIIPGVGQYYNHHWFRGLGFLGACALLLAILFVVSEGGSAALTLFLNVLLAVVAGGSILHAYRARAKQASEPRSLTRVMSRVVVAGIILAEASTLGLRVFLQPFKIPTASMAPTLRGLHHVAARDHARVSLVRHLLLRGERRNLVRARSAGVVLQDHALEDRHILRVGDEQYIVPRDYAVRVMIGEEVETGGILAEGFEKAGDHVLVNRLAYRSEPPARGDVVVFSTEHIDSMEVRANAYYIKRIAGLPGERISIRPPAVYINGSRLTEPVIFNDIAEGHNEHGGYEVAQPFRMPMAELRTAEDEVVLGEGEFFVLGDNSSSSLDSRYFGPIRREHIVGKVVRVYWPFDRARVVR